jgi:ketosteroid isomerase-like protein
MASANLELVRSIYAAWERGDLSSTEWAHPTIEFVIADGPDHDSWKGLAAMASAARDRLSAWDDWRVEADGYRELDNERVLVLFHRSGRGKMSGLDLGEIRSKGAHLFQVRGGQVTRLVQYLDGERALADLGLTPQDGPHGS